MPLNFLLRRPRPVVIQQPTPTPPAPTVPGKDYTPEIAAKADKGEVEALAREAAQAKAAADEAARSISGLADSMQAAMRDAAATAAGSSAVQAQSMADLSKAVDRVRVAQEATAASAATQAGMAAGLADVSRSMRELLAQFDAATLSLAALPALSITFGGAVALQAGDQTVKRAVAGVVKDELILVDATAPIPAGFQVKQAWASAAGEVTLIIAAPLLAIGVQRTLNLRLWCFR